MRLDTSHLIEAGHFNKPHGIKGEISATVEIDGVELDDVRCLFVEIDGIMVPFFPEALRPRSADTWLVTLDGIDSEIKAKEFANRPFWLLPDDVPEPEPLDPDADGFYAADLIGFQAIDSEHGPLGTIDDVNDTTDNVLFVVLRPDGRELLIPVADEFIEQIDVENNTITTCIPQALLELND